MKVVFGVLDWGLGHATRDMPLIEALLKAEHKVEIISTGRALKILREKFGKKCKYHDVDDLFVPKIASSFYLYECTINFHKMIYSFIRARYNSRKIINSGDYDLIISDCRYDVYGDKDKSILINHIFTFDLNFIKYPINFLVMILKRPYGKIVVPDFPGNLLSGKLSLPAISKYTSFIGISSHIKKKYFKEDIDYFISLSGPEPQRTILEEKIIKQSRKLKGRVVIAGANPDKKISKKLGNIKFYNFLNSKQQEEMMNRAKFIITRSGYTTILNLVELEKKNVLLIPTPGQPEQEYLAKMYKNKRFFNFVDQEDLDLSKDIKNSLGYKGFKPLWKTDESVNKFIKFIGSN